MFAGRLSCAVDVPRKLVLMRSYLPSMLRGQWYELVKTDAARELRRHWHLQSRAQKLHRISKKYSSFVLETATKNKRGWPTKSENGVYLS